LASAGAVLALLLISWGLLIQLASQMIAVVQLVPTVGG
jgi:hypothetical protein